MSIMDNPSKVTQESWKFKMVERKSLDSTYDALSPGASEAESDSTDQTLSELDYIEDEGLSTSESDSQDDSSSDFDSKESQVSSSRMRELSFTMSGSSSMSKTLYDSNNQNFIGRNRDIKI